MKDVNLKKLLFAAAAVWLMAAVLIRPELFSGLGSRLAGAIMPVVTGVILAAAADPAVTRLEAVIAKRIKKRTAARGIAIAIVYCIAAAALTAAIWIIVPSLIDSARLFINSLDGYYSDFRERYDELRENDPLGIFVRLDQLLEAATSQLPQLFGKTYSITTGLFRSAAWLALGAVLSVYMLAGKDQLLAFLSGAFRAILSEKAYSRLAHIISTFSSCLSAFISGQLTEALVLGTLCFVGMVIFGFEYPLLISTIIGVTALVPVVGAIAGTIPSALMLFLVRPVSALWFVVFILVLQQLENNLIYPRIVGKSVGLPPLLILIAIIVGAEFGGAAGIMIGIPMVSAAYVLVRERCVNRF